MAVACATPGSAAPEETSGPGGPAGTAPGEHTTPGQRSPRRSSATGFRQVHSFRASCRELIVRRQAVVESGREASRLAECPAKHILCACKPVPAGAGRRQRQMTMGGGEYKHTLSRMVRPLPCFLGATAFHNLNEATITAGEFLSGDPRA